jgi:hypothetical protein
VGSSRLGRGWKHARGAWRWRVRVLCRRGVRPSWCEGAGSNRAHVTWCGRGQSQLRVWMFNFFQ